MCYDGFVKSARFPGAPRTMRPRDAVLLTPSESSGLSRLRSYILSTPVTPLDSILTDLSASVANKRLTESLNPLNATLTKNMGEGAPLPILELTPYQSSFATVLKFSPFILLRALLQPQKYQLFCFQAIPNSFAKTPGVGYSPTRVPLWIGLSIRVLA